MRELTPSGGGWHTEDKTYAIMISVKNDQRGSLSTTICYEGDTQPTFISQFRPMRPFFHRRPHRLN
jgi:hypothetical protein